MNSPRFPQATQPGLAASERPNVHFPPTPSSPNLYLALYFIFIVYANFRRSDNDMKHRGKQPIRGQGPNTSIGPDPVGHSRSEGNMIRYSLPYWVYVLGFPEP